MTCTLTDGARKFRRWRCYRPTRPHLEGPSRLKSTYSTRLAGLPDHGRYPFSLTSNQQVRMCYGSGSVAHAANLWRHTRRASGRVADSRRPAILFMQHQALARQFLQTLMPYRCPFCVSWHDDVIPAILTVWRHSLSEIRLLNRCAFM